MTTWTENCQIAAQLLQDMDPDRLSRFPEPEGLTQALLDLLMDMAPGTDEALPQCGHQLVLQVNHLTLAACIVGSCGARNDELARSIILARMIMALLSEADGAPIHDLWTWATSMDLNSDQNRAVCRTVMGMCHEHAPEEISR